MEVRFKHIHRKIIDGIQRLYIAIDYILSIFGFSAIVFSSKYTVAVLPVWRMHTMMWVETFFKISSIKTTGLKPCLHDS